MRITKEDTIYLKGIGILMIIMHNFFHVLKPLIGENEFAYEPQNSLNFLSNLSASPLNFPQALLSYFGHYGVQIFIFCSGYGLTVIYRKSALKFKPYILKRLYKLYPTFIIGIILLLAYQVAFSDFEITTRTLAAVLIRISLVANWIPDKVFSLSGPYWFYSMIVQLYILFPLLLVIVKKHKQGLWYIMLACYVIVIAFNSQLSATDRSLYYNFIGNLPVFILGIMMAHNIHFQIRKSVWVLAVLVFIAGQFNNYLWSFSQITFLLISLPALLFLYRKTVRTHFSKFILFTGRISMYLFVVNGFMRMPWVQYANEANSSTYDYLYAGLFLILVYLVALFLKWIEQSLLALLNKRFDISPVK